RQTKGYEALVDLLAEPKRARDRRRIELFDASRQRLAGWQSVRPSPAGAHPVGRPRRRRRCPLHRRFLAGALPEARDQHADALAVAGVFLAVKTGEVVFLIADRDQYVDRYAGAKQQVPGAHVRSRPEGEEEARIERVRHPFVEHRLPELRRLRLLSAQVEPGLLQPE